MSGGALAFQKLNGAGTQMQNLIDSVNKSDLYRMAKEFAPGVNLFPVTKSWEIVINENAVNDLSLGGLYFGKWIINHNSQDVADNNNGKKRSQAFLKYGGDAVARTMVIVRGDDILAWGTSTTEHYGFATSLHLYKLEDDQQPQHGVQVSFIGYLITTAPGFAFPHPVVTVNPNNDGNIHLSATDLSSLGYTYQWNVVTGEGNFVDPNNPNAVFVPDGNGNYEFELVVTGNGNSSEAINIPVTVDLTKVTFVSDSEVPYTVYSFGNEITVTDSLVTKYYDRTNYVNLVYAGSPHSQSWNVKTKRDAEDYNTQYLQDMGITNNHPAGADVIEILLFDVTEDNGAVLTNGLDENLSMLWKTDGRVNLLPASVTKLYYPRTISFNSVTQNFKFQRKNEADVWEELDVVVFANGQYSVENYQTDGTLEYRVIPI